ncbi:MAG: transporter substrate-binding domain-containing protein [Fusobacteriaceae bacterium]
MKKLLGVLFLGLSILGFAKEKILIVGTNAEYKPYEYLDGEKIVGFDIEYMETIAKNLGYKVQWADLTFDGLLPALQMKKVDVVIAGMVPTAERKKAVDFSAPYIIDQKTNLVVVGKDSKISKKEDLKGKLVGAQLGTVQEQQAKDLGAVTKSYPSFVGALLDLQNKKLEAVVIENVTAEGYLKTMKDLKAVDKIVDTNPGSAIAFRKGDKLVNDINKQIEKLKKDGTYDKLYKKYFIDMKK